MDNNGKRTAYVVISCIITVLNFILPYFKPEEVISVATNLIHGVGLC